MQYQITSPTKYCEKCNHKFHSMNIQKFSDWIHKFNHTLPYFLGSHSQQAERYKCVNVYYFSVAHIGTGHTAGRELHVLQLVNLRILRVTKIVQISLSYISAPWCRSKLSYYLWFRNSHHLRNSHHIKVIFLGSTGLTLICSNNILTTNRLRKTFVHFAKLLLIFQRMQLVILGFIYLQKAQYSARITIVTLFKFHMLHFVHMLVDTTGTRWG